MSSSQPSAVSSSSVRPSTHLPWIDGLRGLCAVYVACYHLIARMGLYLPGQVPPPSVLNIFALGHYAVVMFIILSGWCLMAPVAQTGHLSGGLRGFAARRAWRILPPYYAALFGTVLVDELLLKVRPALYARFPLPVAGGHPASLASILVRINLSTAGGTDWRDLWTHVFMIHNWFPKYVIGIDGPMWSVATECQIYIVFALLLVPLWQRCGAMADWISLGAAVLIGWVISQVNGTGSPMLLGVFAMGMLGAAIRYSPQSRYSSWQKIPAYIWGMGSAAIGAIMITLWVLAGSYCGVVLTILPASTVDFLVGAGCVFFLLALSDPSQTRSVLVRLLSCRVAIGFGTMSYTLYLCHMPMLYWLYPVFRLTPVVGDSGWLFFFGELGAILMTSWVAYRLVERPTLQWMRQRGTVRKGGVSGSPGLSRRENSQVQQSSDCPAICAGQ